MKLYSNNSFIQIQHFQGKPNELFPEAEFESHQLPGGKLQLSPHGKWLASCGTDGAVQLRAMGTLVCMYSFIYLRKYLKVIQSWIKSSLSFDHYKFWALIKA